MRAFHRSRFRLVFFAGALATSWPVTARAQTADQVAAQALRQEMAVLRADFEARMAALESRLAGLAGGQGAQGTVTPPAAAAQPDAPVAPQVPAGADGGQPGSLPVYGAASATSKIFNPDVAVIGNFLGATGSNTINPQPGFSSRSRR